MISGPIGWGVGIGWAGEGGEPPPLGAPPRTAVFGAAPLRPARRRRTLGAGCFPLSRVAPPHQAAGRRQLSGARARAAPPPPVKAGGPRATPQRALSAHAHAGTGRTRLGTSGDQRTDRRTPTFPSAPQGASEGLPQTLKQACSRKVSESAMCVQRFDDSLSSAIHITYRISLRSSSLQ